MPIYEFECKAGHRSTGLFPASDIPKSITCDRCLKRARKIVSRLGRHVIGNSLAHVTDDDGEYEARREQREYAEWRIALGVSNGQSGKGTKLGGATTAGVNDKKEKLKHGVKAPGMYTWDIDTDKLNGNEQSPPIG